MSRWGLMAGLLLFVVARGGSEADGASSSSVADGITVIESADGAASLAIDPASLPDGVTGLAGLRLAADACP